jgi:hypothetical protein
MAEMCQKKRQIGLRHNENNGDIDVSKAILFHRNENHAREIKIHRKHRQMNMIHQAFKMASAVKRISFRVEGVSQILNRF